MSKSYDRGAEDLGNIVALEHVNLQIEDQGLATLFGHTFAGKSVPRPILKSTPRRSL